MPTHDPSSPRCRKRKKKVTKPTERQRAAQNQEELKIQVHDMVTMHDAWSGQAVTFDCLGAKAVGVFKLLPFAARVFDASDEPDVGHRTWYLCGAPRAQANQADGCGLAPRLSLHTADDRKLLFGRQLFYGVRC